MLELHGRIEILRHELEEKDKECEDLKVRLGDGNSMDGAMDGHVGRRMVNGTAR